MTTPQPYTPCSRAAQDYAFSLAEDPFSSEWRGLALAFDAGRSHMAHQMAHDLHPSRAWGSSVLPAAPISVKVDKSFGGPMFAEVYLAFRPLKTLDELALIKVSL